MFAFEPNGLILFWDRPYHILSSLRSYSLTVFTKDAVVKTTRVPATEDITKAVLRNLPDLDTISIHIVAVYASNLSPSLEAYSNPLKATRMHAECGNLYFLFDFELDSNVIAIFLIIRGTTNQMDMICAKRTQNRIKNIAIF